MEGLRPKSPPLRTHSTRQRPVYARGHADCLTVIKALCTARLSVTAGLQHNSPTRSIRPNHSRTKVTWPVTRRFVASQSPESDSGSRTWQNRVFFQGGNRQRFSAGRRPIPLSLGEDTVLVSLVQSGLDQMRHQECILFGRLNRGCWPL